MLYLWAEKVLRTPLARAFQRDLNLAVVKRFARSSCVALFRANMSTSWPYFLALLLAVSILFRDAFSFVANFRTSVAAVERPAARASAGNDVQMARNISADFLPAVASLFCQNSARRTALVGMTIVMNRV